MLRVCIRSYFRLRAAAAAHRAGSPLDTDSRAFRTMGIVAVAFIYLSACCLRHFYDRCLSGDRQPPGGSGPHNAARNWPLRRGDRTAGRDGQGNQTAPIVSIWATALDPSSFAASEADAQIRSRLHGAPSSFAPAESH